MKAETKVKRALAQLDSAIQAWYAENNPKNKDHYASATFMNDTEDNYHVSRITLNTDIAGHEFTDIKSSKQGYSNGKGN